jgi:hypothetical protein
MNMASGIFLAETTEQQLYLVLICVTYLEKEEEDTDLTVNRDADEIQTVFYKRSTSLSPMSTYLNQTVLTLLFRLRSTDICTGRDNCRTVGLANVAGCSGKGLSCAICEDTGLSVDTVMAHEIGRLLGSSHDSDDDHPQWDSAQEQCAITVFMS